MSNDLITINDGILRTCNYCDNTTFHIGYNGLITCNCCYEKWNPLKSLHKLFKKLGDIK